MLNDENSPRAGLNFQDDVYARLCELAAATHDTVERVTDTPGSIPRCKKGDFVVHTEVPHHGMDVKVAIEVTDEDLSSPTDLKSVMEEIKVVAQNRGADAVLYVFRQRGLMPEGLPAVKVGRNFVIGNWEGVELALLLDLARSIAGLNRRIEEAARDGDDLDVEAMTRGIEEVGASLENFDEVHRLLGLVETHARKAAVINGETKKRLQHAVDTLTELMSSA